MKLKKSLAVILSVSLITSLNATIGSLTNESLTRFEKVQKFLNDHKELVIGGVAVTSLGGGILIGYNCKKCNPYVEIQEKFKKRMEIFSNALVKSEEYKKQIEKIDNQVKKLSQKLNELNSEEDSNEIKEINRQIMSLNESKLIYETALTLDTNEKAQTFIAEYSKQFAADEEIQRLWQEANNKLKTDYTNYVIRTSKQAIAQFKKRSRTAVEGEVSAVESEEVKPSVKRRGSWPRRMFSRRKK